MMNISVTYNETDIAKALRSIVNHPNKDEFVKLLTPMICNNSAAVDYFFKLMIGNQLPAIIPVGTLCRMPVSTIGYGMDKAVTREKYADSDGCIIVTVKDFRGYHEYSQYHVEYTGIDDKGNIRKDSVYVRATEIEVIEEF